VAERPVLLCRGIAGWKPAPRKLIEPATYVPSTVITDTLLVFRKFADSEAADLAELRRILVGSGVDEIRVFQKVIQVVEIDSIDSIGATDTLNRRSVTSGQIECRQPRRSLWIG
jgi:hypothetical protein